MATSQMLHGLNILSFIVAYTWKKPLILPIMDTFLSTFTVCEDRKLLTLYSSPLHCSSVQIASMSFLRLNKN